MVFGKIEYLNLLPFHVFMKRFLRTAQEKMSMEYKRSVPAKVNRAFHSRRVDAAFISSISAQKSNYVQLGIIAKSCVRSVLVAPANVDKKDKESASSNVLAEILGFHGEVLIGDKALKYALTHSDYIDLAEEWHKKYRLPFVFALLCYHKEQKRYKQIERNFSKSSVKIPQYILQEASLRSGVAKKDILAYLQLISYRVDKKAELGLKKFYTEASKVI